MLLLSLLKELPQHLYFVKLKHCKIQNKRKLTIQNDSIFFQIKSLIGF